MYGFSATLVQLLGARHIHARTVQAGQAPDSFEGWRDFRRAGVVADARLPSRPRRPAATRLPQNALLGGDDRRLSRHRTRVRVAAHAMTAKLPLTVPLPPRAVRLAMQQVQHVFSSRAAPQSGKNTFIKHFRAASRGEQAQAALRTLVEAVHQGLKTTDREFACDIWLQPPAMSALIAWRAALDGAGWGLAGEISRALAGSRCVPANRLLSWRLDTRGYDIPTSTFQRATA